MQGERIEFEMTEQDLKDLLEAAKPIPYIAVQCGEPSSPQQAVNAVWARLGERLGFETMTVRPVAKKGQRFFSAVEKVVSDG